MIIAIVRRLRVFISDISFIIKILTDKTRQFIKYLQFAQNKYVVYFLILRKSR